jgi:hypothetical protein
VASSALALGAVMALAPVSTAGPITHRCGNVGTYHDLTATGLTCAQARTLLSDPSWTFHWSCTFAQPGHPEVCHHGDETITWVNDLRGG